MPTIVERRRTFRDLHERGCFTLPNPWDIGTARYLEQLGFKAIATTSAGFAFSRGLPDYAVPRDEMLDHLRELVEATGSPVNADFANGYADEPDELRENVRLCVATGVAGLSIEDSTGQSGQPLYELEHAVDRIMAARSAIDATGGDTILIARTECFLVGREDMTEAISRLTAFAGAGADCLYAPGVSGADEIRQIVAAVAPKPVNVLISAPGGLTVAGAAALGVRRVSVGGALARVAWGAFIKAATQLLHEGEFDGFENAAGHGELTRCFRQDTTKV